MSSKVIVLIITVFQTVLCCQLCYDIVGNVANCMQGGNCVTVLNTGPNYKRLTQVRVRTCNVIVRFNRAPPHPIMIKDRRGKTCNGKFHFFFLECVLSYNDFILYWRHVSHMNVEKKSFHFIRENFNLVKCPLNITFPFLIESKRTNVP
jgi:hypothetical protein